MHYPLLHPFGDSPIYLWGELVRWHKSPGLIVLSQRCSSTECPLSLLLPKVGFNLHYRSDIISLFNNTSIQIGFAGISLSLLYCWWFRNPAVAPPKLGISHYLHFAEALHFSGEHLAWGTIRWYGSESDSQTFAYNSITKKPTRKETSCRTWWWFTDFNWNYEFSS